MYVHCQGAPGERGEPGIDGRQGKEGSPVSWSSRRWRERVISWLCGTRVTLEREERMVTWDHQVNRDQMERM